MRHSVEVLALQGIGVQVPSSVPNLESVRYKKANPQGLAFFFATVVVFVVVVTNFPFIGRGQPSGFAGCPPYKSTV